MRRAGIRFSRTCRMHLMGRLMSKSIALTSQALIRSPFKWSIRRVLRDMHSLNFRRTLKEELKSNSNK
jgi:hypothetical protein